MCKECLLNYFFITFDILVYLNGFDQGASTSRLDLFHFTERIKEMQMQKFMRNNSDFKMDKGDECKDDAKC